MQLSNYQFKPSLIPSIVTILLLILLLWLGNWQMTKAQLKFKDRSLREDITRNQVVSLELRNKKIEQLIAQHVRFIGRYDNQHQAVLANIKYRRRPGFFLLTPVKIVGSNYYVLVVRGWLKQTSSFNQVPEIPTISSEQQQINGIIERAPSVGIKLGKPDQGQTSWPKVLSYVDFDWYEQQIGHKFLPYVIREKGDSSASLIRDWAAFPAASISMPAEKNLSYAFQWYSLAAVLLVIYLVVNLKRKV